MEDSKLFQVIDEATKLGKFGDNYKLLSLIPSNVDGEDHGIVFAEVKLQKGSSEQSVHVLIKRQPNFEIIRLWEVAEYIRVITDAKFYNEVLMYNEILPLLDRNGIVSEMFPKFIYGKATLGDSYEDDIVVVEDLKPKGFRSENIFLDFEHCALALEKIGRFHALSYAMKQENSEEFYKLVDKLKETTFIDKYKDRLNHLWAMSNFRGVESLEKETDEYKTNLEKMKKKFEDVYNMIKNLCQPEEPVAVLCHGDFCFYNMIFQYDTNLSTKPVDVRFFNVASARYTSPAIDLTFFLLMNTSAELRRDHWDDFFDIYYESLSTTITPQCSVPSLEDIKQDFRTRALYGYTLCSYFTPIMMDEQKITFESLVSMKPKEFEKLVKFQRDERVTKVLTDIIRDLARLDCV